MHVIHSWNLSKYFTLYYQISSMFDKKIKQPYSISMFWLTSNTYVTWTESLELRFIVCIWFANFQDIIRTLLGLISCPYVVRFLLEGPMRTNFHIINLFHAVSSPDEFLKSKNNKYHRMIWAHIISRGLVHLWTHIYMHIYNFIIRKSRSIIGW